MVLFFVIWLLIFFGVLVLVLGLDCNFGYVCWMLLIGLLISFVMMLLLIMCFDKMMVVM